MDTCCLQRTVRLPVIPSELLDFQPRPPHCSQLAVLYMEDSTTRAIHAAILHSEPARAPSPLERQIRARCGRTMDTICGSRIRGRNGGSSMVDSILCGLIVVVMADPVSRWHQIMVVDHDRGGG
ncbi:unnamed protein product [Pleuronectes platessa]|uniref:Uncharacterized protein n=1 Tax=Pleuronectes platessa TaxID=8262 RepID=A0A9N7YEA9_PLEPL|nr:unnamed protein product [Pleuronectes platessa]